MEVVKTYMDSSAFTPDGEYFALLSVDGILRIWDATSGAIVQEFPSTSTVQSVCTCLCWTGWTGKTFINTGERKRKRKQGRIGEGGGATLPSIAIGTEKGAVLSYSPTRNETETASIEGHDGKVNCVVYCEKTKALYSCSNDKFIIEWTEGKQTMKTKWKGDEQAVKKLCLSPSGESLLSAGCSIKLWDLKTKNLLQTFLGHSSPVTLLRFSPYKQNLVGMPDDGYYFVSGSTEDRVISAWQVNSKKTEKMAVTSFIISDAPAFADVIVDDGSENCVKLCVGSKDGKIQFFTCTLNGRSLKPITSYKTVDHLLKSSKSSRSQTFINGQLTKLNADIRLKFVSGQTIAPSFSTLSCSADEAVSKIENEMPKNMLLADVKSGTAASTDLASMGNAKVTSANIPAREEAGADQELSLEERLSGQGGQLNTNFIVKMKENKDVLNAGSFAQLLTQALHSSDDKLLSQVLYEGRVKPDVVLKTVKRLPNNIITKLIATLSKELQWNPNRCKALIIWLRSVVSVHLTYILSNISCRDALSNVLQFIKTQEEIHMPLLALQGKIDMFYSQSCQRDSAEDERDFVNAAVVYNDDSDDGTDSLWREVGKGDQKEMETSDDEEEDEKVDETTTGSDAEEESGSDDEDVMSGQSDG